jgi:hypothetical protein
MKLKIWVQKDKTEVLWENKLTQLALAYFWKDFDGGKERNLITALNSINNNVSKEKKKIEFLGKLSKLMLIDSFKYVPLLYNDGNGKYGFNFQGVSETNRDDLLELHFGQGTKLDEITNNKITGLFSIQYIAATLCVSRCSEEDKNFELEIYIILLEQLSILTKDIGLTNYKNSFK